MCIMVGRCEWYTVAVSTVYTIFVAGFAASIPSASKKKTFKNSASRGYNIKKSVLSMVGLGRIIKEVQYSRPAIE